MLTNWGLKNFKSIKNASIDLAPLTILTGTNSSGKSSFLQSILLIAQTLRNRTPEQVLMVNGNLVKLGEFRDIQFCNNNNDGVEITFTIIEEKGKNAKKMIENSMEETMAMANNEFYKELPDEFREAITISEYSDEVDKRAALFKPSWKDKIENYFSAENGHENNNTLSTYLTGKNKNGKREIDIKSFELEHKEKGSVLYKFTYDGSKVMVLDDGDPEKIEILKDDLEVKCFHFIPDDISATLKEFKKKIREEDKKAIEKIVDELADDWLENILNDYGMQLKKTVEAYKEIAKKWIQQLLANQDIDAMNDNIEEMDTIDESLSNDSIKASIKSEIKVMLENNREKLRVGIVNDFLLDKLNNKLSKMITPIVDYFSKSLNYLGPLRFLDPIHPISLADDPKDVGITGEYLASVIDAYRNLQIYYIPPPADNDTFYGEKTGIEKTSFIEALEKWSKYLGVAEKVDAKLLGNMGYKLIVKVPGSKGFHDFTQVGAGVSQVLPIVTACLLADIDSTLIFEQPEYHLHPKVQSRLVDLFISMIKCGKQCLIETHSEYFINALRYQVVATEAPKDEELINKIKIYFVEKNDDEGSTFRSIEINKYGSFSEWPIDFFDERSKASDNILYASIKKKEVQEDD